MAKKASSGGTGSGKNSKGGGAKSRRITYKRRSLESSEKRLSDAMLRKANKKMSLAMEPEVTKEGTKAYKNFQKASNDYYTTQRRYQNAHRLLQDKRGREAAKRAKEDKRNYKQPFVNGFGEATKRYITSAAYERAQRRQDREIFQRLNNRQRY